MPLILMIICPVLPNSQFQISDTSILFRLLEKTIEETLKQGRNASSQLILFLVLCIVQEIISNIGLYYGSVPLEINVYVCITKFTN